MLVTINNENKQVNVTIQGGTMTVELERGNFVLEDAVNTECDFETEEDYARLLHDAALSLVTLGNDIKTFEQWEELFSSWADVEPSADADPEDIEEYNVCLMCDRADFEREQKAAADWKAFGESLSGCEIPEFDIEKYQEEYRQAPKEEKEAEQ